MPFTDDFREIPATSSLVCPLSDTKKCIFLLCPSEWAQPYGGWARFTLTRHLEGIVQGGVLRASFAQWSRCVRNISRRIALRRQTIVQRGKAGGENCAKRNSLQINM
jgi:hypothetical protein